MKAARLFLILAACAVGCERTAGPATFDLTGPHQIAQAGGLAIAIELPRLQYVRGETVPVRVIARNLSSRPITIQANTGNPVFVKIYRLELAGWEEILRYPEAAIMVLTSWTLQPGQQRSFVLNLTVQPSWPTAEPLLMTAELNGVEGLAAGLEIRIISRESY